jgi:hypothetical protein
MTCRTKVLASIFQLASLVRKLLREENMSASSIAGSAEKLLADRFEAIGNVTKYISAFRTRRGREMALERDRDGLYLWTEQVEGRPIDLPAPEAYEAKRTRNSNLKSTAKRLQVGKAVWYWRLERISDLETLCTWYASA